MAAIYHLSADTVVDIFMDVGPQKEIGRRHGISASMVSNIKRGHCYAAVTEPLRVVPFNGFLVSAAFMGAAQ
jgi:hypothetical protein